MITITVFGTFLAFFGVSKSNHHFSSTAPWTGKCGHANQGVVMSVATTALSYCKNYTNCSAAEKISILRRLMKLWKMEKYDIWTIDTACQSAIPQTTSTTKEHELNQFKLSATSPFWQEKKRENNNLWNSCTLCLKSG